MDTTPIVPAVPIVSPSTAEPANAWSTTFCTSIASGMRQELKTAEFLKSQLAEMTCFITREKSFFWFLNYFVIVNLVPTF